MQVPGISWSIWIIIIIIIHLEIEWRNLLNNLQLKWEFKKIPQQKSYNKISISCEGCDYNWPLSPLVSFRGQPQTNSAKDSVQSHASTFCNMFYGYSQKNKW